jgi:hypothetical protein
VGEWASGDPLTLPRMVAVRLESGDHSATSPTMAPAESVMAFSYSYYFCCCCYYTTPYHHHNNNY